MSGQATDTAPVTTDTAPDSNAPDTQATDTQGTTTPDVVGGTATDTTTSATETPPADNGDFSLPEEYKDKPWAEKVKSPEDAYKQIENLTTLVGKKTIQPIDYETASEEDIAAHHTALAPENGVEGYTWSEEALPEISKPMSDVFLKAGINAYQQKLITEGFDGIIGEVAGQRMEADTSAEGYLSMMKESFGDEHEAVAGKIENVLKEHVTTDEDKKVFDSVDNTTRAAIDRTVHSLTNAYEARIAKILEEHGVTESGAQAEGGEAGVQNISAAEQRSTIRARMRELDGTPNGYKEIAELQTKLNKLL